MPTGNKATTNSAGQLTSLHSPFTVSPTEYSVGVTGDSALTTDEVIDLWAWKGVSENAWERFQSKKYFRTHSLSHSLTLTHTHSGTQSVSQSVHSSALFQKWNGMSTNLRGHIVLD